MFKKRTCSLLALILIVSPFAFFSNAQKLTEKPTATFSPKIQTPIQEANELSYSIPNYKNHKFEINNFKFNDVFEGKIHHYFQTDQHIFKMKANNDKMEIINFMEISVPDIMLSQQSCTHFVFDPQEIYSISTCKDLSDNSIYLVMVSWLSSKPFYAYTLQTNLSETIHMKLSGDLLVILDQDPNFVSQDNNKLVAYQINIGSSRFGKQPVEFLTQFNNLALSTQTLSIASFNLTQLSNENGNIYEIKILEKFNKMRKITLDSDTGIIMSSSFKNLNTRFNTQIAGVTIDMDFDFLSNTTVHSWFYTFLIVFGCLIVLSFCTQRTAEGRDTIIVERDSMAKSKLTSESRFNRVSSQDLDSNTNLDSVVQE